MTDQKILTEIPMAERRRRAMILAAGTLVAASLAAWTMWQERASAWSFLLVAMLLILGVYGTYKHLVTKSRYELSHEAKEAIEQERRRADFAEQIRQDATNTTIYKVGFWITWTITFIASWIYCISTYGYLLGVGLGWLPSLIVATVAAFVWPLIALVAIAIFVYVLYRTKHG